MDSNLNFDVGPKKLWTPDRDIPLDGQNRNTTDIHPAEMKVIEAMDTIAQRHHIVLACEHCRRPFKGFNSGHATTQAITCGCRELRAVVRQSRVSL